MRWIMCSKHVTKTFSVSVFYLSMFLAPPQTMTELKHVIRSLADTHRATWVAMEVGKATSKVVGRYIPLAFSSPLPRILPLISLASLSLSSYQESEWVTNSSSSSILLPSKNERERDGAAQAGDAAATPSGSSAAHLHVEQHLDAFKTACQAVETSSKLAENEWFAGASLFHPFPSDLQLVIQHFREPAYSLGVCLGHKIMLPHWMHIPNGLKALWRESAWPLGASAASKTASPSASKVAARSEASVVRAGSAVVELSDVGPSRRSFDVAVAAGSHSVSAVVPPPLEKLGSGGSLPLYEMSVPFNTPSAAPSHRSSHTLPSLEVWRMGFQKNRGIYGVGWGKGDNLHYWLPSLYESLLGHSQVNNVLTAAWSTMRIVLVSFSSLCFFMKSDASLRWKTPFFFFFFKGASFSNRRCRL